MKRLKNIIRWFFGLGFLFSGAASLKSSPVASLFSFGISTLLIPPLESLIFTKLKISLPNWSKVVLGVFFFGVVVAYTPPAEKVVDKSLETTEQVATSTSSLISTSSGETRTSYMVSKVIDGDTIQVNITGKNETVRLIGIDTPESVDPRKPVQCFALEASKKAKEVLTGKSVYLEVDSTQGEKDKYNRLLRYVFLEDGANFNKLMIELGYGHQYTYNKPYKYMEEFKEAERLAVLEKRGLWADDACLVIQTPTVAPVATTVAPPAANPTAQQSGGYTCGTKTKCGEMSTCAEAKYFLTTCGVSRLDADSDGTPCESICN